jgi:hypothetical protein
MSHPIQTTSTFNIQNLVTPGSSLGDTPVDVSRMLYMLYQDVEQQINRADFKAQITLGTSTLLAALAVNLGLGFGTPGMGRMFWLEWIALGCYTLCAICICGAIGFAVAAVYPRSIGKGLKSHADLSLYFSADVIKLPPDEYVARFIGQTNEQLKESVLKQFQIKSRVLEAKLGHVRSGLRALVGSLLFWALGHGTLLIAYGRLIKG